MATKKEMTEAQLRKAKADDAVVYKVMLALVLLLGGIMGLRSLRGYYATVGGYEALYDGTLWVALAAFLAAAGLGAALVCSKNKYVRAIAPWCLTASLLVMITALVMHYSWTTDFPLLYILFLAVMVQYIVLMLYGWEFFLVSLLTVTTGSLFYQLRQGGGLDALNLILLVFLALVMLVSGFCAYTASKNKGALVHGKTRFQIFSRKFHPAVLYTAIGLWLVCVAAALLLGSVFSYYCMFAAVAVELIAAVYYTFQLN